MAAGRCWSAVGCLAALGVEADTSYGAICMQLIAMSTGSDCWSATDLDLARKRGEVTFGYRRRRAQRDPANRSVLGVALFGSLVGSPVLS